MKKAMITLVVMLLLVACSGEETVRPEGDLSVIRIGVSPWPGYEVLMFAGDRGLFPTVDGVEIETVYYPNAPRSFRAFEAGEVNGLAIVLPAALDLVSSGVDATYAMPINVSDGADVLLADPERVSRVADLPGLRIGVEPVFGEYLAMRALQRAGLDPASVTYVEVAPEVTADFLAQGLIDAATAYPPVSTQLRSEFGLVEIFDSSQIPGEITDILVLEQSVIDSFPGAVSAIQEGFWAAIDLLEGPERIEALAAIADRQRTTVADLELSLSRIALADPNLTREIEADTIAGYCEAVAELMSLVRGECAALGVPGA